MTIRDKRQDEFANLWINSNRFNILNLCPRFGKIFTVINILERVSFKKILIAYPDKKIKISWEKDFTTRGYNSSDITYTTHLSIKNHTDEEYDLIVIDEIHLLSENQIIACQKLFKKNKVVIGLTGTLSKETQNLLYRSLSLHVLVEYPIATAITEGVIVDYRITVVQVPLDTTVKAYKDKTEKGKFDALTWVINKLDEEGKDSFFLRLSRMRIIQNSIAKQNKTKALLSQYRNERVLVFCGVTKIADNLGIPAYHDKVKEKSIFEDFVNGKGNHLAVVKIGNTGVTYTPLDRIIINYFDSNSENLAQKLNRAMGFEYNNPEKIAKITIICSNEEVERKWLKKALEFFDKSKITYI